MKCKYLIIIALLALASCTKKETTKIVANHGYWKNQEVSKGSESSLKKAEKLGCHYAKYDVYLTKDNVLIIANSDEIKANITESSYSDIKSVTMANNETILTLSEILKMVKDMDINLELELKNIPKDKTENTVKRLARFINSNEVANKINLSSTSLSVCKQYTQLLPESNIFFRHSSHENVTLQDIKKHNLTGVYYDNAYLRANTNLINECKSMGIQICVYNTYMDEDISFFIEQDVDYINTDKPDVAMKMI